MNGTVDLLGGPAPTLLPVDAAQAALAAGRPASEVVLDHPASPVAWAVLAQEALNASQPVIAYACARTGYHRGLDALRRSGWKGHGPVPWSHEPNRGWLRCVAALSRAAREFGELDEEQRCRLLLTESDPSCLGLLELD